MENAAVKVAKEKYKELFPDEGSKAAAFNEIAERYYYANFGTMQKVNLDTLMFSLYLDKIFEKTSEDMSTYSDYNLSKWLGVTQSRVRSLKERKELAYPSENFDWKKAFGRVLENYRYENGKIKLNIPDKNVYTEIDNVIEKAGGYIDVQLNAKLLQVDPEYFVDILVALSEDKDRDTLKEELIQQLKQHEIDPEGYENRSFGDTLKATASDAIPEIIGALVGICVPYVGGALSGSVKSVSKTIIEKLRGGSKR